MTYKIGQRVKIVKKADTCKCSWWYEMDKHIGKIFTIECVSPYGNYKWKDSMWWFPPESLKLVDSQLVFSFMED